MKKVYDKINIDLYIIAVAFGKIIATMYMLEYL